MRKPLTARRRKLNCQWLQAAGLLHHRSSLRGGVLAAHLHFRSLCSAIFSYKTLQLFPASFAAIITSSDEKRCFKTPTWGTLARVGTHELALPSLRKRLADRELQP